MNLFDHGSSVDGTSRSKHHDTLVARVSVQATTGSSGARIRRSDVGTAHRLAARHISGLPGWGDVHKLVQIDNHHHQVAPLQSWLVGEQCWVAFPMDSAASSGCIEHRQYRPVVVLRRAQYELS